jgi:hypothetical protein
MRQKKALSAGGGHQRHAIHAREVGSTRLCGALALYACEEPVFRRNQICWTRLKRAAGRQVVRPALEDGYDVDINAAGNGSSLLQRTPNWTTDACATPSNAQDSSAHCIRTYLQQR